MSDTRVGVIGLGAMGGAVAERLVSSGFTTSVYDTDEAAVNRIVAHGALPGTKTSVARCDVLLTSLPSDRNVLEAVIGSDALSTLSGGTLIELSTILPDTMKELAAHARKADVHIVDSPVSGGPNEARAGTLVLLVGAEDADVERARPVLDAIGTIERVGSVGQGKAMKLVNNTMSMGNMVVAAEAFTLGKSLGLEPRRMFDTLSRSGGRSHAFAKRIPYALDDDFTARFALYLGENDLRLALEMAHGSGHPMPVAACIHQVYETGLARGLAKEDMVAVIKVYGEWHVAAGGAP